jgi:hypothetical protein
MRTSTPSPSPLGSPQVPPPLWSRLDASAQQQLAQCFSDLIRRMRGVPAVITEESRYEIDAHGHQDH